MGLESNFSILPGTTVHWENNHATLGGAICVRDASPVSYCDPHKPKEECFFQFPAQNLTDIKLIFKNNSADTAGSVLYGGAIDYCKLTRSMGPYSSGEVFDMIFNIHNTDYSTISNISSNTVSVCPCENNLPNCSMLIEREVYPGETFQVSVVALGLVCKLTVATGTLSGLVFYANIVGINRNIFLPVESTNAFSIFIAWLNLDFGIETCFYDGLDTYSKTWLQFVFPVYIWVLVGLMVQVSRFSQRFASLLGNNPVSVLSTLILLSYTKILRTLIAVLYLTYLEYPTYNRMVMETLTISVANTFHSS